MGISFLQLRANIVIVIAVARSRQVYREFVVEALLIVFLPGGRADTYSH
jgi:hypothetical protein